MNVSTHVGVFGRFSKVQNPDGSIILTDPAKGQYVDVAKSELPLSKEDAEAKFTAKYGAAA